MRRRWARLSLPAQAASAATLRRAGWTAVDQVVSSLGNFVLGVMLARSLSRTSFGAFGVAFAAYGLLLSASRALGPSVLQVRFTVASPDVRQAAISSSTSAALLMGVAGGTLLAVAGWILDGQLGDALLAMGLSLPGLLAQDGYRLALLTFKRSRGAAGNDLVWLVAEVSMLGAIAVWGSITLTSGILGWGGAAYLAAAVGAWQLGVTPALRRGRAWITAHRDIGLAMAVEFFLIAGIGPTTVVLLGLVADLREVAALRGAEILLAPANLVYSASALVIVPEAARVQAAQPERLGSALRAGAWGIAALVVAYGSLVLAVPGSIGRMAVGDSWLPARAVVLPLTVHLAATAYLTSWLAGLHVFEAVRDAVRLRVMLTPLYLVTAIAGIAWFGARGAAAGMAIVSVVGAYLMRRRFMTLAAIRAG